MGCRLSKNDLVAVQSITGMSEKDARASYMDFKKKAGGDKMKLDQFTKLVNSINVNKGDVTEYSRHLFRAFDTDKDNYLSWKDVIYGFHNLSHVADKNEKRKLVFRLFDVSGKKSVGLEDIKMIMKSLHLLQGEPVTESDLLEKAKVYFNDCDLNADGKITEDEFMKACDAHVEMFELADSDE